jgi:hypothetical protein
MVGGRCPTNIGRKFCGHELYLSQYGVVSSQNDSKFNRLMASTRHLKDFGINLGIHYLKKLPLLLIFNP